MSADTRWAAPEEFDRFVRDRHVALLRFAHVLSGDPHTAADLVQDALERTGMGRHRLLRRDNPESYVRRAIVNGFINAKRRHARERLVAEPPDLAAPAASSRDERLWRLLATLPRQQRAVLVLRFYEDLTETDIAAILGCRLGTVKSNSSRALAKLRAMLPEFELPEGSER
jgi:RNA polymerase sigma-70 factor (sigma-E family)